MRRLRDLLLELFADPRPLRQHLRMDARTVVLLPNLPGEPASLSDVVHALVQQVVRDGLTRALIDGLCAAFPLRRGEIEAVGKAVTDAVPTSGAQADEEIVRYRRVMAAMYGSMRFIGIPRAANAPEQTLRDGFVPLALGRIGYQPHWTPVRLLCQLLRPWTNTLRIIALGDPGAGKTTLCRFLTTVLAGGIALEGVDVPANLVPLHLVVREYGDVLDRASQSILDHLERTTAKRGASLSLGTLAGLCQDRRAVLLIDGLDEAGDPARREELRGRILAFCALYPSVPVFVTTRGVGYDEVRLPEQGSAAFLHLTVEPLSDTDLADFVRRWYTALEPDETARAAGIADLLASIIAEPTVRDLARIPLALPAFWWKESSLRLNGMRVEV